MYTGGLKEYLDAFAYGETRGVAQGNGRLPFITISRQAGAGGRSLARTLIAALDREEDPLWRRWLTLDQELCRALADDPELCVSIDSLLREEYRSPLEDYAAQLVAGLSPQETILRKEFRLVRAVAQAGKAVIIGRAGCLLTRDLPAGVHLRLTASLATRRARLSEAFGLTESEAERWVREQDESRARLFTVRFKRDIEDPLLYDAAWNTDSVGLEDIAAATIALLKARTARLTPAAQARS